MIDYEIDERPAGWRRFRVLRKRYCYCGRGTPHPHYKMFRTLGAAERWADRQRGKAAKRAVLRDWRRV